MLVFARSNGFQDVSPETVEASINLTSDLQLKKGPPGPGIWAGQTEWQARCRHCSSICAASINVPQRSVGFNRSELDASTP